MSRFHVVNQIAAPQDVVFEAVSNINRFPEIIPDIVNVEFLTEQHVGVGTRFRETRDMNGRKATVELEVTEHGAPEHCRIVSDTNGYVWDTIFAVTSAGDGSQLEMKIEARPERLLARFLNLLIRSKIERAVESNIEHLRLHCETSLAASN